MENYYFDESFVQQLKYVPNIYVMIENSEAMLFYLHKIFLRFYNIFNLLSISYFIFQFLRITNSHYL